MANSSTPGAAADTPPFVLPTHPSALALPLHPASAPIRTHTQPADLSRPVFRYLREQAWRRPFLSTSTPRPLAGQESRAHAGPLATLVQRARAMRVVPDVVPHATPTVDVQVYFGQGAGFGDHGGEGGEVLPGVFVDAAKVSFASGLHFVLMPVPCVSTSDSHAPPPPSPTHAPGQQTLQQPRIEATPFHVDTRRYTLLLLDPDSPDEHKAAFRPYAHWLLEDVELSATQTSLQTGGGAGKEVLSYVPPHPQRGTPYHRYTVLLLSREAGAASGAVDSSTNANAQPIQREAFDVRAYMQQRGLGVAGLHFWRGIWKEGPTAQAVEQVYRDVLGA